MKGDFSRRTFDQRKHYSAVLHDQGRMLSEADLEEEHRILAHRIEQEAADLIGGCGGPLGAAGFAIFEDGAGGLTIGGGRYYVDGILVENEAHEIGFDVQPDRFPLEGERLNSLSLGRYQVFLDVWRRLITAIDDPTIREVALGGPTTSDRERIVWQVRLSAASPIATCHWPLPELEKTTGLLTARANPVVDEDDPCIVPPTAGYKGLENQFYRIEVHDSGGAYSLTSDPESTAIVAFTGDTRTQVTVAGGAWHKGDRVEIYRAGTGLDLLPADLFVLSDVTAGTNLTLNRAHQAFGPADAPRVRKARATFVWSRDNGSIVTAIDAVNGADITVTDVGPDCVRGFQAGQWVEMVDDSQELESRPGTLAWVHEVIPAQRMVRLNPAPDPAWFDKNRNSKLRRWDGAGAIRFQNPAPGDNWIDLEDGIQVTFTAGQYRTGDYWHFPARTATLPPNSGNIEWPEAAGGPKPLLPHGIEHHVCPLAIVDLVATGEEVHAEVQSDCRNLFPPVTELTNLLYVGGDGQEGLPDPAQPGSRSVHLDAPLQVRVANGGQPVDGATVRFTIPPGGGNGQLQNLSVNTHNVQTDSDGIATCKWLLDGATPFQSVEAHLLDAADNVISHQVVRFHANLSVATQVAYFPTNDCPDLADAKTVQDAIDALCQREAHGGCCCVVIGPEGDYETIDKAFDDLHREHSKTDICLCLLPGDHALAEGWSPDLENPLLLPVNLKIAGCGAGTRLDIGDNVYIRQFNSFVLSELDLFAEPPARWEIDGVREVRIETCRVAGSPVRMPLLKISNSTNVYVGNSTFEAIREPMDGAIEIFDFFDRLSELFKVISCREFLIASRAVAVELVGLPQDMRQRFWLTILTRIEAWHLNRLSMGEETAYRRFAYVLLEVVLFPLALDPLALVDCLIAIREESIRVQREVAIEIGWSIEHSLDPGPDLLFRSVRDPGRTRAGEIVVENNVLIGALSFYGEADRNWQSDIILEALAKLDQVLHPEEGQGPVIFDGLLGVAHVRDNHLTQVLVAQDLSNALVDLPNLEGRAQLETVFKSLHCTDNVIDGSPNVFMAEHVALTANNFTLDAVRGLGEDDAGLTLQVATVVGDTGMYVGNHGRGAIPLVDTVLREVTRTSADSANLELTVV